MIDPPSIVARGRVEMRADGVAAVISAAILMHQLGHAKRPRPVPRGRYPMVDEIDYGNQLAAIVERMKEPYRELAQLLPRSATDSLVADEDPLVARRILETLRERMQGTLNLGEMEKLAAFYGDRVSRRGREQLANQLRAGLGVDIPVVDPQAIRDMVRMFARENAALISRIPENLHNEVANLTMQAFTNKWSRREFAEKLEERFEISESRARFIARDQVGKLNAQLSEERNTALGIKAYYWRTRRDKRVRKEHRKKEGRRFLYSHPPKGGHAGHPPGCRCVQEPDLSDILDQIEEARRFPGKFSAPLEGTLPEPEAAPRRAPKPKPAPKPRPKPPPPPPPPPPAPPAPPPTPAHAAASLAGLRRGDVNAARHAIEADVRATYRLQAGNQTAGAGNIQARTYVEDRGMSLPGGRTAAGLRHWDGSIQITTTVERDARQFAAAWDADPAAMRARLASIGDPYAAQYGPIGQARDAAAGADGVRVIAHEVIHGFGPMRQSNYVGVDAHVEELATEALARRYVADRYGVRLRLRDRGPYAAQIEQAIEAIRETYGLTDTTRMWELLERGAMAFKGTAEPAGRDLVAILADAISDAHGGHDRSDELELVLRRRLGRI